MLSEVSLKSLSLSGDNGRSSALPGQGRKSELFYLNWNCYQVSEGIWPWKNCLIMLNRMSEKIMLYAAFWKLEPWAPHALYYEWFWLKKTMVSTKIEIICTHFVVISLEIHIMKGRRELSFSLEHPLPFSMAQPKVNFSHMQTDIFWAQTWQSIISCRDNWVSLLWKLLVGCLS